MLIRSATIADAAAIAGLVNQLGYETGADLIGHKLDVLSWSADEAVLLAVVNEQVAGCRSAHAHELFHVPGRLGGITSMVVDADARGRGVGRALVDEAMAFFRARGCIRVEVTSGDHRPGAHAFYQSVGFIVDERRFVKKLTPTQEVDSSAARGWG